MPLLAQVAESLSEDSVERGILETFIQDLTVFNLIDFQQLNSRALVYQREKTLSYGAFLSPVDSPIPENAATFSEVMTKLRILAGQVRIDKFLDSTMSDQYSQRALQIAAKVKGMRSQWLHALINGDSDTNVAEFDGLLKLASADKTITAGGAGVAGPLSYELLDELKALSKGGVDAFFMRPGTIRAYTSMLRSVGGITPQQIMTERFGAPVMQHEGVIMIESEFLPGDEVVGANANTCSILGVRFSAADGVFGLYGGSSSGFVIEDLGTHAQYDSETVRVKAYTTIGNRSEDAIVRLNGITNV